MDGVINILKPAGLTSHDVVSKLRKIFKTKKIGHTGTLDPDAVGVLPICVGQGTRLVEYLMEKDKTYRCILRFGQETDTQDASGEVTKRTAICQLDRAGFSEVLTQFVGESWQIPPMYSAIKRDGQPLYKLARQGIDVAVEARPIRIHEIKILMYNQESAMLDIHCGKGTYIRTLCQDIGRACGSSGHMAFLMRTQSGRFTIDKGVSLDKLAASDEPTKFLTPILEALEEMPSLLIEDRLMSIRLSNGLAQHLPQGVDLAEECVCKAVYADQLLAIGVVKNGSFEPNKVFKRGE